MKQENRNQLTGIGKIYAGEVHYSRIPVEYWEHRIQMIKSLGLNTLSIYIMWNYHEISKGHFDFKTDNKNLPLFLQLAEKNNMMVLFRPGPYVCAEWDFGGMPARLLSVDGLVLRANNQKFLQQTKIYFQALVPIMKKFLRTSLNPKGCIIMLQIQNQYGFYGKDKSYMQALRKIWKDLDIKTNEYYVDWPWFIKKCHWQGAHIGINNFSNSLHEKQVRLFQKKGVVMGGEIYTGWMTHWTEKWGGKSISKVTDNFKFLLKNGYSFAMYLVHGGTNFGLTAGANGLDKTSDYWGALTSYDYDAPINQQGSATQKYHSLRNIIKKYVQWQIPEIPDPIPMINIEHFDVSPIATLFENLPSEVIDSKVPYVFESKQLQMFNQGIVLYETVLPKQEQTIIKIVIHDFALVYLGNKCIEILDRTKNKAHSFKIKLKAIQQNGRELKILVESSGHINFDKNMQTDKKGIYEIGGSLKNLHWRMYRFPIDFDIISKWKTHKEKTKPTRESSINFPILLKGQFSLPETGDVYLDMSKYGKGYVWINGKNLGRYWNVGPQLRLFCPGVWMKKGKNILHILNICGESGTPIKGVKNLRESQILDDEERSKCQLM